MFFSKKNELQKVFVLSNDIVKNTYTLLSGTLLFSIFCVYLSYILNIRPIGFFSFIIISSILQYLILKFKDDDIKGIILTFLFTGFMGISLGPIIKYCTYFVYNGAQIILQSLFIVTIIFLSLASYMHYTKKDISYIDGIINIAFIALIAIGILGFIFHIAFLYLIFSFFCAVFSSSMILWHINSLIQGGEENYIIATMGIFIALFNLFSSILQILISLSYNDERE